MPLSPELTARLARIQTRLGTDGDGLIGVSTITRIEQALDLLDKLRPAPVPTAELPKPAQPLHNLLVSEKAIDKIIEWEVSDRRTYEKNLIHPTWPGGASGVTIGLGYDCGYYSPETIANDWRGLLSDADIKLLQFTSGHHGEAARLQLPAVRHITVPWDAASKVFHQVSVPKYARFTAKAYPGIERLPADAQGAMLSITFNRGVPDPKQPDRFRELFQIKTILADSLTIPDMLEQIAQRIQSSKRLWVGKGLDGLLSRRDEEARLVRQAVRHYEPSELVDC
jgi:hypothetical protein